MHYTTGCAQTVLSRHNCACGRRAVDSAACWQHPAPWRDPSRRQQPSQASSESALCLQPSAPLVSFHAYSPHQGQQPEKGDNVVRCVRQRCTRRRRRRPSLPRRHGHGTARFAGRRPQPAGRPGCGDRHRGRPQICRLSEIRRGEGRAQASAARRLPCLPASWRTGLPHFLLPRRHAPTLPIIPCASLCTCSPAAMLRRRRHRARSR